MERVTLPAADDLEAVAAGVCADGGIEEHWGEVVELSHRCLSSPSVARAIHSGHTHREVPFTMPAEDGGFVTGRMDLVFRDGDRYVIVDYKTDAVELEEVEAHTLAHHAGQASAYASAISGSAELGGTVFVYPRAGAEVTIKAE